VLLEQECWKRRVGRIGWPRTIIMISLWLAARPPGEYRGRGKVAERNLDIVAQRIGDGLPLGGEDRIGPKCRRLRMIWGVAEQSEWRRHSIGQNPVEQGIGIRRSFDEYGIWLIVRQRRHQRSRRTGSVVADAEHFNGGAFRGSPVVDDMIVNRRRRQH
jgi:hypothetical protein